MKLERGEVTLTIRYENSTEVRQAGRESRTLRQTGQDEILRLFLQAIHLLKLLEKGVEPLLMKLLRIARMIEQIL